MTENLQPKDADLQTKTETEEQEEVDWGEDPPEASGSKSPVKENKELPSGPTLPGPFVKREVEKTNFTVPSRVKDALVTKQRTSGSTRGSEN